MLGLWVYTTTSDGDSCYLCLFQNVCTFNPSTDFSCYIPSSLRSSASHQTVTQEKWQGHQPPSFDNPPLSPEKLQLERRVSPLSDILPPTVLLSYIAKVGHDGWFFSTGSLVTFCYYLSDNSFLSSSLSVSLCHVLVTYPLTLTQQIPTNQQETSLIFKS